MSVKEGTIKLENMPNEYVQLKDELLYEMIDTSLKLICLNILSKETGLSQGKLLKFHSIKNRRKSILVKDLEALSDFLVSKGLIEYSLKNLQKQIATLGMYKGISEPKFPLDFNSLEGVSIIGDILTDGFVTPSCGYANSDPIQIINNLKIMNKLFCNFEINVTNEEIEKIKDSTTALSTLRIISERSKVKCKIYTLDDTPTYSVRYHRCLSKILEVVGIKSGDKVKINPNVPDFVFRCQKELIIQFLLRIFINEGTIKKSAIFVSHSLDVTSKLPGKIDKLQLDYIKKFVRDKQIIPNLILDYQRLLSIVGCKSGKPYISRIYFVNEEIHVSWGIYIVGKDVEFFKNNSNIEISKKLLVLKRRIKTYYSPEDRNEEIMKFANEVNKFTSKELAEKLHLSQSMTNNYLRSLIQNQQLTRNNKGRFVVYVLTK